MVTKKSYIIHPWKLILKKSDFFKALIYIFLVICVIFSSENALEHSLKKEVKGSASRIIVVQHCISRRIRKVIFIIFDCGTIWLQRGKVPSVWDIFMNVRQ